MQIDGSTKKHGITINKLFHLIGNRSNYILTFFACLLISLPLPLPPGFSTLLALPSVFISIQNLLFNRVFVPNFIGHLRISKNFIRTFNKISQKYLIFIEKITRRRLDFITSKYTKKLHDIALFLFTLCSMIPIPFICIIPAVAGMLLSAGLVVKDGLLIVISWIIGCIGIILISGTIETLFKLKDIIPNLI